MENIESLYVASYQLACTVDHEAVLQAIQEIVVNLIGSEEVGVYEMSDDRTKLRLVASFGLDPERFGEIGVGEGTIGACAATGEVYVSPTNVPDAEGITACVPLRIESNVIGAVAIFGLLPHKPELEEADRSLIDVLAVHGATSLYCSKLHAQLAGAQ